VPRLRLLPVGQEAQVGPIDAAQPQLAALGVAQQVLAQRGALVELRSPPRDVVIDRFRGLRIAAGLGLQPRQLEL
jgi:hypothetical protein